MCDPKWVISAGACASTGGFFTLLLHRAGNRRDHPGRHLCGWLPARPEAFLEAVYQLQQKIDGEAGGEQVAMGSAVAPSAHQDR